MRIVIVEDEAPIRNGMGNILIKINDSYEVVGKASNGLEGLEMIRKELPDLIIMDIHMPDMDGLTMLAKLREENINSKVVVLTAYSEFSYAKQAIELGIENYLLKPLKIPELKETLKKVELELKNEKQENEAFSIKRILRNALSGQLEMDAHLQQVLKDRHEIRMEDKLALFLVWLGKDYSFYRSQAGMLLRDLEEHSISIGASFFEIESKRCMAVVFYQFNDGAAIKAHLEKAVIPMLHSNLNQKAVYGFSECEGLRALHHMYKKVYEYLDWNLSLGERQLICPEQLEGEDHESFKYPLEVETQIRQAVMKQDEQLFKTNFRRFGELCHQQPYNPKSVKEACIRYCWTVLSMAKEYGNLQGELFAQKMMQEIVNSITWEDLRTVLEQVFKMVTWKQEIKSDKNWSGLIQRAQSMIQEYYSQGITLEEIARSLSVSEEYLSSLFRKETGMSFTETIRKCRVEHIKKLLRESNLKLTQIAAMVGYSDPKYMSRVFKEEVGMLPAEFRKMNI